MADAAGPSAGTCDAVVQGIPPPLLLCTQQELSLGAQVQMCSESVPVVPLPLSVMHVVCYKWVRLALVLHSRPYCIRVAACASAYSCYGCLGS